MHIWIDKTGFHGKEHSLLGVSEGSCMISV